MKLPFAFEEPFFDREVHAYDLRLAKALIKLKEKDDKIEESKEVD